MTSIGSYRTRTRRPDAEEDVFAKLMPDVREEIVRGFLQQVSFKEMK